MIGQVLEFVRKHVCERLLSDDPLDVPGQDPVLFVDSDAAELTFSTGAVSLLLMNVEEERILRRPDLYARNADDGTRQSTNPDIRLILYMLFVARFPKYDHAWEQLSKISQHFQTMRVMDAQSAPDLPAGVERLIVEMVTLGFAEQNEIWSALRGTYRPSLLYRVHLVGFHSPSAPLASEIGQVDISLEGKS